jgi:hypothetical protein
MLASPPWTFQEEAKVSGLSNFKEHLAKAQTYYFVPY